MRYKSKLNPELRRIAVKIPYNKFIIWCANIYQPISYKLTKLPAGIRHKRLILHGYKNQAFKTDIYEPTEASTPLPCLLYIHGGAFSYKASSHQKKLACRYAREANCRVYFPDYHLTPKHPYPAAYQDVLSLYRYISAHSAERIGVAGDSAGAAIAALIASNYEKENLPRPFLQMLIYPLTDIEMQTKSMKNFTDTPLWNAENNRRMWSYYCRGVKKEDRRAASPMHSDFPKIIPDAYIETAEYDCLHDEGIEYGKRLQKAGASVELNETKGTIHGYDIALNTRIAEQNIEKRIEFLRKSFHASGKRVKMPLDMERKT